MSKELAQDFSTKDRALIIFPAGCGKTELIAQAISFSGNCEKKQLILTHTHAGIKSISDRLQKYGVLRKIYNIDTIDGFSLKYASNYPITSCLGHDYDVASNNWEKVIEGAIKIISTRVGKTIINESYCGLYIDEYQDCSPLQHRLILLLAELLPTRIVGDPLQGIFDFGGNKIVDWYKDVFPNFIRIGENENLIPHRWQGKNEELGKWLFHLRHHLKSNNKIDLSNMPPKTTWKYKNNINQNVSCTSKLISNESSVAIHNIPNIAHDFARRIGGIYSSMEEMESKDLFRWLAKVETSHGNERVIFLIEFSSKCMTKVSTELITIKTKFIRNDLAYKDSIKHKFLFEELIKVSLSDAYLPIYNSLIQIRQIIGAKLFRDQLWFEFLKVIYERALSIEELPLKEIALKIQDRNRLVGRRIPNYAVSRPLLIKGLEFDNAIVLDADTLNMKEFYVAVTRGSRTLTILSESPSITKQLPNDLLPVQRRKY